VRRVACFDARAPAVTADTLRAPESNGGSVVAGAFLIGSSLLLLMISLLARATGRGSAMPAVFGDLLHDAQGG
jgi:hypothetical protein